MFLLTLFFPLCLSLFFLSRTIWMTIFWAHRTASICLTDQEERDSTLDLSRQYEWQSGYTFDMHLEFIEQRWNQVDSYRQQQQQQQQQPPAANAFFMDTS